MSIDSDPTTRRENGRNKLIARPAIMRREKGAGISVSGLTRPLFPPAISFLREVNAIKAAAVNSTRDPSMLAVCRRTKVFQKFIQNLIYTGFDRSKKTEHFLPRKVLIDLFRNLLASRMDFSNGTLGHASIYRSRTATWTKVDEKQRNSGVTGGQAGALIKRVN